MVILLVALVIDLLLLPVWSVDQGFGARLTLRGTDQLVPIWLAVIVIVVLVLLLQWRRQHPWRTFLAVFALTVATAALLTHAQLLASLIVAMYAVASRSSAGRAKIALALTQAHVVGISVIVAGTWDEPLVSDLLIPLFFFGLLVAIIWGFARLDAASYARSQAFDGALTARAEQATQEERRRIARELHDILAHSVSAMMMQAAGARAMAGSLERDIPDDARLRSVEQALGTIEATGSQSMRELHRLLGAMRQGSGRGSSLDLDAELTPGTAPGLQDLDDLVETPRRSGLIVEVHRTGTPGALDPSVGVAAYRVVQEALTNSLKHAGRGAVIDVYEAWQDKEVTVQVRCRGSHEQVPAARPDTPNGGTGLSGLRERVELAGGRFEADWVGEEFVTSATLPTLPPSDRAPGPRAAGDRDTGRPPLARP